VLGTSGTHIVNYSSMNRRNLRGTK
jgi:hypothetical protein